MPVQSLIGGILGGFNRTAARGRAEAAAKAEKQADRESSLLLHLATTSDDPEIADMAASALVDSTLGGKRPKEGYFNRLIGGGPEATNPAVANIMALIRGGGVGPAGSGSGAGGVTPSAPAVSTPPSRTSQAPVPPPTATTPGRPGQLAQAPTSMGQTGATSPLLLQPPPVVAEMPGNPSRMPQMSMVQPPPKVNTPPDQGQATEATESPAGPVAAAAVGGPSDAAGGPPAVGGAPQVPLAPPKPPPTVMDVLSTQAQGRHIWLTPAERQRQANRLHAEGIDLDLRSEYDAAYRIALASGMGDAEAKSAARQKVGIGGGGNVMEGNVVPDTLSPTGYSQQLYRVIDGVPQIVGQIPAQKPGGEGAASQEGDVIPDKNSPTGYSRIMYDPKTIKEVGRLPAMAPAGAGKKTLSPQSEYTLTKDLAGQWTKATEDLRIAQQQQGVIRSGADLARTTGDMNAATEAVRKGYAKLTDVASAVREAEFELGTRGQPLSRKFEGLWQKLEKGGIMLTQADLDEYVTAADAIVKAYDTLSLKGTRERIHKTADYYGIPDELVFYDKTTGVAPRFEVGEEVLGEDGKLHIITAVSPDGTKIQTKPKGGQQ